MVRHSCEFLGSRRTEQSGRLLTHSAECQLGLLLRWIIDDGHATYMVDEATVVFISDVGAAHKVSFFRTRSRHYAIIGVKCSLFRYDFEQAQFIAGTALTFLFYSLSLFAERYLRQTRRIPGVLRRRELWADVIAVIFGCLGGLALLLLS